ncbi:Predicted dehydrogenase [Lachnospiraceae bacterium XBD2001]|nr:Predicted dehydrogenase [Lachnospiraceae bacterium XBD2001]
MKVINKVLVVGYGSMGRRRIRLTSELLPDAVFYCVDSNVERQKQATEDGHQAVSSLQEGLDIHPDIAFVCTSPGHHAELLLQIVAAGVPVFTELNLTSNKYDMLLEASVEYQVPIFVSSTLVYKKQMNLFKEMVGKQSKPLTYMYHVGQYLPDWHPWESYKDFFIGRKETNGIREIMAIQLPWIVDCFGKIADVRVTHQKCTDLDIQFPDSVILSIVHESGHIGVFVVDVTSRKATTHLEVIGEDIHVFWDGHNDDLFKLNIDTKELESVEVYASEEHVEGYSDNIAEEPYRDEIREFIRTIDGESPRYGLENDAYILGIIDQIEKEYMSQYNK